MRELRFLPCPRYSTRVYPVDDVFVARLDIPARGHMGEQTHETYGVTAEEAKRKVAFVAITDLCEALPAEIAHTSLRYIPMADPGDALWLDRLNNIPYDPPNHDALLTVISFASEAASLYRGELVIAVEAREDRLEMQEDNHDLRVRVADLEGELAQAHGQIEDLVIQVQHLNDQVVHLGLDEPVILNVMTHIEGAPVASDDEE